jgi:hypothetical protein
MRHTAWLIAVALGGVALAQDAPEFPKPQKEHQILKQFEGDWDATCRMIGKTGTDKEEAQSKGHEVAKVSYGGFWMVMEFTGEAHQKSFDGRGTIGYDPVKQKYVLTWIDSLNPRMMTAEGTADKDGRTLTFYGECVDPSDKKQTQEKLVFEFRNADTRTLTFSKGGPDVKEQKGMEILYTRSRRP